MTKIMKWLSITMLLLAVLQLPVASHPVLLAIVVSASSLLVVAQALRAGKYSWAVGGTIADIIKKVLGPFMRCLRQAGEHLPFLAPPERLKEEPPKLPVTSISVLKQSESISNSTSVTVGAGLIAVGYELEIALRSMRASKMVVEDSDADNNGPVRKFRT